MAIAEVQNNGVAAPSGSAVVAYTANVTTGNLLVAVVGTAFTSAITGAGQAFSDSAGNTWTLAPTTTGGGTFNLFFGTMGYSTALYYAVANAGSGGTKPTVTYTAPSASAGFGLLFIFEFSPGGSGTWTIDQSSTGTGASGTTASTAAASTTQANEAVVALPVFNSGTGSAGAGFTATGVFNNSVAEYRLLTSTTAGFQATGANSTSTSWMIQMATFYLSGGGAAPAFPPPSMGARRRALPLRHGRATNPILTQAPIAPPAYPPARTVAKRRMPSLPRGKRPLVIADHATPPRPWRLMKLRVAFRMPRGKQWSSATLSGLSPITPPLIYSPLTTAGRQFRRAAMIRGRRTGVVPAQIPVPPTIPGNRIGKSRVAAQRRGRRWSSATMVQPVITVAWTPAKVGAPRRLFTSLPRGRRFTPTPAQIPVPKYVIIATRAKPRVAYIRRGHRFDPAWVSQVSPNPPSICLPTTATFAAYASTPAIATYTSTPAIAGYESDGEFDENDTGATFKTCGI